MNANHPEGRLHDCNVGGRDVDDAEQLACSLYHLAKEAYAANCVPDQLVRDLALLRRQGAEFAAGARRAVAQLNAQRGYP